MNYVVLLASDPSTLSSLVNNLIDHGWKPQGGVAVTAVQEEGAGEVIQWAQAMVKPAVQ